MQTTMILQQDAVPIVKSSLEMKRKALDYNLREYHRRLMTFEQTHHMTWQQFIDDFRSGKMGDDATWFEWEFLIDALAETERQLKLLDSVKL
mgnify:CR=1 FL=1